jgi:hypothetical protein
VLQWGGHPDGDSILIMLFEDGYYMDLLFFQHVDQNHSFQSTEVENGGGNPFDSVVFLGQERSQIPEHRWMIRIHHIVAKSMRVPSSLLRTSASSKQASCNVCPKIHDIRKKEKKYSS